MFQSLITVRPSYFLQYFWRTSRSDNNGNARR